MEIDVNARQVVSTLPEPILLVARDGRIAFANGPAHELLQQRDRDLINRDICTLVLEPAQKLQDYLTRCSRNGAFTVGLFTFRRAIEEPIACRCEGARLFGGKSPLILIRQTPRSIASTAFVALNEQIKALNRSRHQLESEVRSRTAELVEAESALRQLSTTLMQAQDDERRRIARELHDSAGQLLTAIQLNLTLIPENSLSSAARKRIQDTIDLAHQATSEVRGISHLLHPPLLDEEGLPLALQTFIDGFQERSGIATHLEISGLEDRPEQEIETAVFRIVQECLANIHRHSGSKTAEVLLHVENDALQMTIRDYGRGLKLGGDSQGSETKPGVGIRGMQERVRLLRGHIEFLAADPGTRVVVRIPCQSAGKEQLNAAKAWAEEARRVNVR